MQIGALAEVTGIAIPTIRYYEQRGLLPNPPRQPSGYRVYSPDIIRRVVFIKRAKELGFSLEEISELLCLEESNKSTAKDIRLVADKKLIEINQKVQSLQRIKRALKRLLDDCPGSGPKSCCTILASLADEKRTDISPTQ